MGCVPHRDVSYAIRMTYYPDLAHYDYLPGQPTALTIGWLDVEHPFPTGELAAELIEKLHRCVVTAPINQSRGFHACDFCPSAEELSPPVAEWRDQTRSLGSAEVWITSRAGVAYACPDLIFHYVATHDYLPPAEVVEALDEALLSPAPEM